MAIDEQQASNFEVTKTDDHTYNPKVEVAQHEFLTNKKSDYQTQLIYGAQSFNFLKRNPDENYLVNKYSLPRGLAWGQRVPVLSESEKFFDNRYSKQAIGELKIKDWFTILGRQTQIDGFKGHRPSKTSYKPRRNSNGSNKYPKSQSCQSLRPMTIHTSRQKHLNIDINEGAVPTDKYGKELFPDFTITPTENLSNAPYLKMSPSLKSFRNYPMAQNLDIEEVKKAAKKYSVRHKFVEVSLFEHSSLKLSKFCKYKLCNSNQRNEAFCFDDKI